MNLDPIWGYVLAGIGVIAWFFGVVYGISVNIS